MSWPEQFKSFQPGSWYLKLRKLIFYRIAICQLPSPVFDGIHVAHLYLYVLCLVCVQFCLYLRIARCCCPYILLTFMSSPTWVNMIWFQKGAQLWISCMASGMRNIPIAILVNFLQSCKREERQLLRGAIKIQPC